jgi:metal-sulfur cluster biosynthetic enzyme
MRTEQILTNFVLPLLSVSVAYVASAMMVRSHLLARDVHRTVWNFALLGSFLGCAGTGILLAFKDLLPDLGPVLRLHDQTGAALLAAGAGHTLERLPYFANKANAWWAKAWKADNHWPQVLASLLALSAFLALPTVLLRLTAGEIPASATGEALRRAPAAKISTEASSATDSQAALPVPISKAAVGTLSRKPKASLREEVERVLSAGRDSKTSKEGLPDSVRFENRSGVPDGSIAAILRQVHDPELHINVYDLGLVRRIAVDSQRNISVAVVFTTPTCPNNGWLLDRMKTLLAESAFFNTIEIHQIPNAYWCSDFITEEGRRIFLEMGKW